MILYEYQIYKLKIGHFILFDILFQKLIQVFKLYNNCWKNPKWKFSKTSLTAKNSSQTLTRSKWLTVMLSDKSNPEWSPRVKITSMSDAEMPSEERTSKMRDKTVETMVLQSSKSTTWSMPSIMKTLPSIRPGLLPTLKNTWKNC